MYSQPTFCLHILTISFISSLQSEILGKKKAVNPKTNCFFCIFLDIICNNGNFKTAQFFFYLEKNADILLTDISFLSNFQTKIYNFCNCKIFILNKNQCICIYYLITVHSMDNAFKIFSNFPAIQIKTGVILFKTYHYDFLKR